MRGHENIIAMRKLGKKPAGAVWLCDYPVRPDLLEWKFSDDCKNPTVCTDGDEVGMLDLRFLVGLPVHVTGESMARVRGLAAACRRANAMRVVASDGKRLAIWNQGDAKWQSF